MTVDEECVGLLTAAAKMTDKAVCPGLHGVTIKHSVENRYHTDKYRNSGECKPELVE